MTSISRSSSGSGRWLIRERSSCTGLRRWTSPRNSPGFARSLLRFPRRAEPMPGFDHDSLRFHYRERGEGFPFIFQHGLGGDLNQPFSLYQPPAGIRLLGFDARGHGQTHPLGDVDQLSIATLADDLIAFLDHLGI